MSDAERIAGTICLEGTSETGVAPLAGAPRLSGEHSSGSSPDVGTLIDGVYRIVEQKDAS